MEQPGTGAISALILIAVVIGIIARPAIALGLFGILAIIAGLFSIVSSNVFGFSFGVSGIIGGVGMLAFSRLIAVAEEQLAETKLLRNDIAALRSTPVEVLDPMEAELRREVQKSAPKEKGLFARR